MSQPRIINKTISILETAIDSIDEMARKHSSTISVKSMNESPALKDDVIRFLSDLGNTLYKFQLAKDDIVKKKNYSQKTATLILMLSLGSIVVLCVILMRRVDLGNMTLSTIILIGVVACLVVYCMIVGISNYITKVVVIAKQYNMNKMLDNIDVKKLTDMLNVCPEGNMIINTNNPLLTYYTAQTKGWKIKMNVMINELIPDSCDNVTPTTLEHAFLTTCVPPSHAGHVYPFLGLDSVFSIHDIKAGVKAFDMSRQQSDLYDSIKYLKNLMMEEQNVAVSREQLAFDIAQVLNGSIAIISDLLLISQDSVHTSTHTPDEVTCFKMCLGDEGNVAASYDTASNECVIFRDNNLKFTYDPLNNASTLLRRSGDTSSIRYKEGVSKTYVEGSFKVSECSGLTNGCLKGSNGAPSYLETKGNSTKYPSISGTDKKYGLWTYNTTNARIVDASKSQTTLLEYSNYFVDRVVSVYRLKDPFSSVLFNSDLIRDIEEIVKQSTCDDVSCTAMGTVHDILMAVPAKLLDGFEPTTYVTHEQFLLKIAGMTTDAYVNSLARHINQVRSCSKGLLTLRQYYDSSAVIHDSNDHIYNMSIICLPIIYTALIAYYVTCAHSNIFYAFYMAVIGVIVFEIYYAYNKKIGVIFTANTAFLENNNAIIVNSSESALKSVFSSVVNHGAVPWSTMSTCNRSMTLPSVRMFASLERCSIVSTNTNVALPRDPSDMDDMYVNLKALLTSYDLCNDLSVPEANGTPFPFLYFTLILVFLVISLVGVVMLFKKFRPLHNLGVLSRLTKFNKGGGGNPVMVNQLHVNIQPPVSHWTIPVVFPTRTSDNFWTLQNQESPYIAAIVVVVLVVSSYLIVHDANAFEENVYNSKKYRDKMGCIKALII